MKLRKFSVLVFTIVFLQDILIISTIKINKMGFVLSRHQKAMIEEVISGKFKDMRSIWNKENFPAWITWVFEEIFAFRKFHLGQEFMIAKIEDYYMNLETFFFHS